MKVCKIERCNRKHDAKGFCKWHYEQQRRNGTISVGRFEQNRITTYGKIAKIALYNKRLEVVAEAIIDSEDIDKVKNMRWALRVGYVTNRVGNGRILFLHNVILGRDPDTNYQTLPDHKNRDTLNNRKDNLRPCTAAQNAWNSKELSNNTSGKKGVCWHKTYGKWIARIGVNGKDIFLGCFKDFSNAVQVRRDAELKYYGEFAT